MKAKIIKRIIVFIATLFVVSAFIFIALEVSEGDASYFVLSDEATEEERAGWKERVGLNRNPVIRYFSFLKSYFTLQWGKTIGGEDVREAIFSRLPVTLALSFWSILLSTFFSLLVVVFALRKNRERRALLVSLLSGISLILPSFLTSLILVLIFSFGLKMFPVAGYVSMKSGVIPHLRTLFLPSLTLAILHSSIMLRVLREAFEESLRMPYTKTALGKGMKEVSLPLRSALRPSLPVILSLVSDSLTSAFGGAVIVENVFALPGLGSLMVKGAMQRDIALTSFSIMSAAFLVSFIFLLSDIASYLIDPRQRRANEEG